MDDRPVGLSASPAAARLPLGDHITPARISRPIAVRACIAKQQPVGENEKRFSAEFLEQGPKLIFKIRKSPLGGGRQMGDVLAVQ
jgi:hypothetical protein